MMTLAQWEDYIRKNIAGWPTRRTTSQGVAARLTDADSPADVHNALAANGCRDCVEAMVSEAYKLAGITPTN